MCIIPISILDLGFPSGLDGKKKKACTVQDLSLIPGSERSSGEESDNSLQFACLENLMSRGGNPWDPIKLDMTEQLTLIHILWLV